METLKRTNSKDYLTAIQAAIIEAIDLSGYIDIDQDELTDRQKVEYLLGIFESETRWNVRRYPNRQDRLENYLMGLPSSINLPFENHEVLNLSAKLHGVESIPGNKQDVILNNYWRHMAFHILKLHDKLSK